MDNARQGGVPTALVFETSEPQGNDDRAPGWLKSVVADYVDHRKPIPLRDDQRQRCSSVTCSAGRSAIETAEGNKQLPDRPMTGRPLIPAMRVILPVQR